MKFHEATRLKQQQLENEIQGIHQLFNDCILSDSIEAQISIRIINYQVSMQHTLSKLMMFATEDLEQ